MSKLLKRQIRKHLKNLSSVEMSSLSSFLEAIEDAYTGFEEDRRLIELSLELSSEELIIKNEVLRQKNEDQEKLFQVLEDSVRELSPEFVSEKKFNVRYSKDIFKLSKFLKDLLIKQKQAQALIHSEEQKLRSVLYHIKDGVIMVDENMHVSIYNKAAQGILGWPNIKFKKHHQKIKFFKDKNNQIPAKFLSKSIQNNSNKKKRSQLVLFVETETEERLPVSVNISEIKNKESGGGSGYVIVFRDISKEREINQMKTEFISIASHQLQTPLTSIKWILDLLMDDMESFDKIQQENLIQIEKSTTRMVNLINDLLNVTQIEAGRKFVVKKSLRLVYKLITDSVKDVQQIAKKRDIVINVHEKFPRNLKIRLDYFKVCEVLRNLLTNAIKYSPKKSQIEVTVSANHQVITFSISDKGIGIPRREQDHLFHKFYRASNAQKHGHEGTGLGLYVARKIVEAHDGEIWLESQSSQGATFHFTLPI